ncbi:MAG: hypothetical protein JXB62_06075 [Pirellulales bacterium]|nr:hypothetical protein [Pirellulales bacterium]
MAKFNRNVPSTIRANLLDKAFGEWTVVGFGGRSRNGGILWVCQCVCGKVSKCSAGNLQAGYTSRCVACSYARGRRRKYAPGTTKSLTYLAWLRARQLGVCKTWRAYENFLRDLGEKPKGARLAKRSRKKPHSPSNSYWHTPRHTVDEQIDALVASAGPISKAAENRLRKHLSQCSRQYRYMLLQRLHDGKPIFRRRSLAKRLGTQT